MKMQCLSVFDAKIHNTRRFPKGNTSLREPAPRALDVMHPRTRAMPEAAEGRHLCTRLVRAPLTSRVS